MGYGRRVKIRGLKLESIDNSLSACGNRQITFISDRGHLYRIGLNGNSVLFIWGVETDYEKIVDELVILDD
jgi:hypothetical protein